MEFILTTKLWCLQIKKKSIFIFIQKYLFCKKSHRKTRKSLVLQCSKCAKIKRLSKKVFTARSIYYSFKRLSRKAAISNIFITQEKVKFETFDKFVYMKQWLKTRHAIMFGLSNKLFQVNFFDNSQILLQT
jgi:hypothetical protein